MMHFRRFEDNIPDDIDEHIGIFEKTAQFVLPEDYKNFLREYNGASVMKGYLCTFRPKFCSEKKDVLAELYGVKLENDGLTLLHKYNFMKETEDLPKRFIPVGHTAFPGVLLLDRKGKVFIWDYAHEYKSSNIFKSTYRIANSFTQFLNELEWEKPESKE